MNYPLKLFANAKFIQKLHRVGKIFPVHVQVCLNNADRSVELSLQDIKRLGRMLFSKMICCQSVTITGDKPLLHPYINEIIKVFDQNAIRVGIITDGTNLHYLMDHIPVYWIDIICTPDKKYLDEQMRRPICRKWLRPDIEKRDCTKGVKDCWVSLMKPVIDPDGHIHPCQIRNDISMGHFEDLINIYKDQKPFDGSKCEQCYNSGYNEMLDAFVNKPERVEWV